MLGQNVDVSAVKKETPDALILATGSKVSQVKIKGMGNEIVVQSEELHRSLHRSLRFMGWKKLRKATSAWMPIGKNVVIIGAGFEGCQLAEFLVKRGRKVTLVDTCEPDMLGYGLAEYVKVQLLPWMMEKNVEMIPLAKYEEITDKGLVITGPDGNNRILEADTIIPIVPLSPNAELESNLKGMIPEIHSIGSCKEPGLIVDAIADGARIGHSI